MKSFRINYFRRKDSESDAMQPDELTVFDQVEFDVEDGNETTLLRLFSDFVAENGYEVLSISTIDEVPFHGYEDDPFQNTYMDRMNTVAASAHSFLSTLAIGGVERNDDRSTPSLSAARRSLKRTSATAAIRTAVRTSAHATEAVAARARNARFGRRRLFSHDRRKDKRALGKEQRGEIR